MDKCVYVVKNSRMKEELRVIDFDMMCHFQYNQVLVYAHFTHHKFVTLYDFSFHPRWPYLVYAILWLHCAGRPTMYRIMSVAILKLAYLFIFFSCFSWLFVHYSHFLSHCTELYVSEHEPSATNIEYRYAFQFPLLNMNAF